MKLFTWGANTHGQLGQAGATNESSVPTEIHDLESDIELKGIVKLLGGGGHSFLIHRDGRVYGCGQNNAGQVGRKDGDLHKFSLVETLKAYHVADISTKWETSFGVTKRDRCIGWGSNSFGQLGLNPSELLLTHDPVLLTSERGTGIASGLKHCAILTRDGHVLTAGEAVSGQLGRPLADNSHEYKLVPGLRRVKQIASGQLHTFAITDDNRLYGWGCNKFGQLGLDPTLHQTVLTPLEISLPTDSIDSRTTIHSGWSHGALLTGNGKIINWGCNRYGQLGSSSYQRPIEWKPQMMNNIMKVRELHIGSEHNIAILEDGVLMSWGWNERGNCGNEQFTDVTDPCYVKMNSKALLAGAGVGHSLAIVTSPSQY